MAWHGMERNGMEWEGNGMEQNRGGNGGPPCFVPDLIGKAFSLSSG